MTLQIKGSGFLYKFAFSWRGILNDWAEPVSSTSTCAIFWGVMGGLIVWPIVGVMLLAAGTVAILALLSVAILTGNRFCLRKDCPRKGHGLLEPINPWPTIRGYRIWPLWIPVLWGVASFVNQHPVETINAGLFLGRVAVFFLIISLIVSSCLWLVKKRGERAKRRPEGSSLMQLIAAHISGVKQKICPVVQIID